MLLSSTLVVGSAVLGTPPPAGAGVGECLDPYPVEDRFDYLDALAFCGADSSGPHTIELTADVDLATGVDPVYGGSQPLRIDGNGFALDAGGQNRILDVVGIGSVDFVDITVRNGSGTEGGAVRTAGSEVLVLNSSFLDNVAGSIGGAIFPNGGRALIYESTFAGNEAATFGSAVYTNGDIDIGDSTIQGAGPADDVILAAGVVRIYHATITEGVLRGGDDLTSFGSVVAACNISGTTTSTYSFSGDNSCGFDDGTDTSGGGSAILGPIRDNGGPTPTMFPLVGSPLPDQIPVADCFDDPILASDQRGVPRPFGTGCDLGAVEAVFPAHGFSDVSPFYEAAVRWVTSDVNDPQILNGFDDGTFRHRDDITRGQAARLYYRAAGAPDVSGLPAHGFSDVSPFFEDAVRWAKANEVFDGFDDGTFRQAAPISRGNSTRSLYRFAGAPDTSAYEQHGLSDVSPFYEDAVRWAVHHGLATGFNDGTFRQRTNITRGNASNIFYNAARAPDAWAAPETAPVSALFQSNLPVG